MALRDEIIVVRDRALHSLNEGHDYFTYTKFTWRSLSQEVMRDGLKFTWQNLATGSKVTETDIESYAQRYVARELACATLQQFVSIFECFLSDVCRAWLLAFPVGIARRQLNGREILSLPDKPAIIDALIEKELRDVFYDRPSNWFGYLNNLVSLGAPTQKDVESFSEIKATRDILVHGQGIANAYYVDKSGKAARVRLGEPINVPEPYHQQSWTLICKLVRDIGDGMAAKA
jgi:hypothetical protein